MIATATGDGDSINLYVTQENVRTYVNNPRLCSVHGRRALCLISYGDSDGDGDGDGDMYVLTSNIG